MRIGLLTKYGNLAASTRQRFLQYRPYLESAGFELISRPLLDDAYLTTLYAAGRRDSLHVAAKFVDRISWLLSRPQVDLIWLHCELLPFLPGVAECLVRWPRKPVIFDYDDAIFHNYDQSPRLLIRTLLGEKLRSTLKMADLAMCGNDYLESYARQSCARTEIVPTVVDTAHFSPLKSSTENGMPTRVGWIGTPSTWNSYMADRAPLLKEAALESNGLILVMGADQRVESDAILQSVEWRETEEISFLQKLDIGIMPLADTPWARGKCGYKLIQYMACGLPVIASPVGVNASIVEHGVNGFLASTDDEWRSALRELMTNPGLRHAMGSEGRRKVEREYSLRVWGPRVSNMLRSVVNTSANQ
jgi:glycosyltransferase involved in cell wall biosynthesis